MTTPADVRQLLGDAEAFLRVGDPYGATSRATEAVQRVACMHPDDRADVQHDAELVLGRARAAQETMRAEVERRAALHVSNERRAAGIVEVVSEPEPPRRSWIATLFGPRARSRTRPRTPHAVSA